MKRARDRGCGQGKYVGVETELLESFLVFDTEAMLLVNDDKSELREGDVGTE